MSFIISGDIHGTLDISKIIKFFNEHEGEYTMEDYLILCGDVGDVDFLHLMRLRLGIYLGNLPVTTWFVGWKL